MFAVENTLADGGEIAYIGNNDGGSNYGGLVISAGEIDRECRLESAWGNSFFTFHTQSDGAGAGERLRIAPNGNVLIGDGSTYSAGSHLHLHGGTSGLQQLRVQNHTSIGSFSGNYGSEFRHAYSSAHHCMLIHAQEASNARRTLDVSDANGIFAAFTNGKLGLGGETTPISTLTINRGSTGSNTTYTNGELIRLEGYDSTNSVHGIGFGRYNGGQNNYKPAAFIGAATGTWSSYTNCHLIFATRNTTGDDEPTERLRITNAGDILIGTQSTNSETGKLDIYHTADNDINNPHIRLHGPGNNDPRIEFGSPTNGGEGGYIMYNDSDEGLYIGSRMATYSEVNICTGMNDGSPTSNVRLSVGATGNIQVDAGYGSAREMYPCRAWANLNGNTNPASLRASRGLSGVTDNGTGDFTFTFSTAFTDSNYSAQCATGSDAGWSMVPHIYASGDMNTSNVRFSVNAVNVGGQNYDRAIFCMAIFR